jgi:hypothetical protein
MIRPLSADAVESGTRGEWLGRTGWAVFRDADPATLPPEVLDGMDECLCGIIELPEATCVTDDDLAAFAAHEFGHACTRLSDIAARHAPDGEFGTEAAADWYAYKWGFGRLIARTRKARAFGHHGPGPGQIIHTDYSEESFRLSRNFVYQRVETRPQRAKRQGWRVC